MINVILETGENRRHTVARATEQAGGDFFDRCKLAETILIKPNLVHHENQLASTHVDAVRGVLDVIRPKTKAKIIIGDAGYHGTKAAMRNFGYEHLTEEYPNVELRDLNDDEWVEGYSILTDGSKNQIRISKTAKSADVKICLTVMKMHRDVGVSLSVKNWTVGTWVAPSRVSATGLIWARWPWLHEQGPVAHHRTIMELYRQLPCDLAIVDGIMAMEGDGPTSGTPVPMGVVLAGTDPFAVDAVACTLMGVDPHDIGYLQMASDENLGVIDMGRIDVPPAAIAELSRHFARPTGFEDKLSAWRS